MLKIGFAKKNIKPEGPVWLAGQFYERKVDEVETPVFVNVMALESDGEQLIICTADLVGIYDAMHAKIKEAVKALCPEIDTDKIITTVIHDHSSIKFLDKEAFSNGFRDFMPEGTKIEVHEDFPNGALHPLKAFDFLVERMSEAIVTAWKKREPAKIARAYREVPIAHCRRVLYADGSSVMYGDMTRPDCIGFEGPHSSDMELLYVFDAQDNPMGVLVNICCPSQILQSKRYVSSDFWGKARILLEENYGEDFCVLGLCGPAGDQEARDLSRLKQGDTSFMQTIEGTWEIGKRIRNAVTDAMEEAKSKMESEAVLHHEVSEIFLPRRKISFSEYQRAKERFEAYIQSKGEDYIFVWRDAENVYLETKIMKMYEQQKTNSVVAMELHTVRLGDVSFATSPFELFLDYGTRIKAQSPAKQDFLIQLACGCVDYLPTEKAERGGDYSAGSTPVGPAGGELLVGITLQKLRNLWNL